MPVRAQKLSDADMATTLLLLSSSRVNVSSHENSGIVRCPMELILIPQAGHWVNIEKARVSDRRTNETACHFLNQCFLS